MPEIERMQRLAATGMARLNGQALIDWPPGFGLPPFAAEPEQPTATHEADQPYLTPEERHPGNFPRLLS
jgi:hypothetical protein